MSDDNSESRIAELEEKVEMMAGQLAKKDRQLANLADLYTAALKQIQDLTTELQEAKGIISAAVARSIGAKPDKKTGSARRRTKAKGKPSVHRRTGLSAS